MITKLDKKYNLNISDDIKGKKNFDIIKAIYNNFRTYKTIVKKTESDFSDFFNGATNKKIDIEYQDYLQGTMIFIDVISDYKKEIVLTVDEVQKTDSFISEMYNFLAKTQRYLNSNFNNFQLLREYFERMKDNWGFGDIDDIYIKFNEFKENHDKIRNYDKDEFIKNYKRKYKN